MARFQHCVVAIGITVVTISNASGWERIVADGAASSVAVDPVGDVVAAGTIDDHLAVAKLRGQDGSEAWRYDSSEARVSAGIVLNGAGDVIVAGNGPSGITASRLSSTAGEERWHWNGPFDSYSSIAIDHAGDVFISATELEGTPLTVVKLSGATGDELWRQTRPKTYSSTIAVDATGNIVLATTPIVELAGTDGHPMWKQRVLGDAVEGILLDSSSNVIVNSITSFDHPRFRIFKLSGASGLVRWKTHGFAIATTPSRNVVRAGARRDNSKGAIADFRSFLVELRTATGHRRTRWGHKFSIGTGIFEVAIDAVGNMVVNGVYGGPTMHDLPVGSSLVKLRGRDGTQLWSQSLGSPGSTCNGAGFLVRDVVFDQHSDVVVAGGRYHCYPFSEFAVAKLSGTTGAE